MQNEQGEVVDSYIPRKWWVLIRATSCVVVFLLVSTCVWLTVCVCDCMCHCMYVCVTVCVCVLVCVTVCV